MNINIHVNENKLHVKHPSAVRACIVGATVTRRERCMLCPNSTNLNRTSWFRHQSYGKQLQDLRIYLITLLILNYVVMHVIQTRKIKNQRSGRAEGVEGGCNWNPRSDRVRVRKTQKTLYIYPCLLTDQTGIPTHLVKIETRVWKRKSHDF